MTTHVVYATYDRDYGKRKYPNLEKTLYFSLKKTFSVPSDISGITVVKAFDKVSSLPAIKGYYDLHEFQDKVKYLDIENLFGSTGQWFLAYEKYRNLYDYYFFMEDDYTMSMPHFDNVAKEIYREYFPDDIGVLCHDFRTQTRNIPHFSGFIFVSSKTMEKLFSTFPKIFEVLKNHRLNKLKKQFRWQLIFSNLMTKAGIPHRGCIENHLFPYWDDRGEQIILFQKKSEVTVRNVIDYFKFDNVSLIDKALELPVQLVRKCFLVREEKVAHELIEKEVSFGKSAKSFRNHCFENLDIDLTSDIQREFPLDLEFAIYVGTKNTLPLEKVLKRLLVTSV